MYMQELLHLLRTAKSFEEIDVHREEIISLIPIIKIMIDYDQQNHAHQYDLWEHCCRTVINLPKDIDDDMVYLAALLHDIGKPDCRTIDYKDGNINCHYYGHPKRSREIVEEKILPILDLTPEDQRLLLYYAEYHDDRVSLRMKHLRRHLRMGYSLEEFQNLMLLQVADAKAHVLVPIIEQRIDICGQLAGNYGKELYDKLLAEGKE